MSGSITVAAVQAAPLALEGLPVFGRDDTVAAFSDDVMRAKAEQYGMDFIRLREIEIPPNVIEKVPESIARENQLMPLSEEGGVIKVIMHNPMDFETVDKLRFVLNREIEVALSTKEAIVEAINHYYGGASTETESVDSMLQEFTDTAIDFTETESATTTSGLSRKGTCSSDRCGGAIIITARSSRFFSNRSTTRSRFSIASSISTPGCAAAKGPMRSGTKYSAVVTAAMRKCPRTRPWISAMRASKRCQQAPSSTTVSRRTLPVSVRLTPRPAASNRGSPIASASSRNCTLTVGCVM